MRLLIFSVKWLGCLQIIPSSCRAMIGQVSGGGRTEKPMLKAGNAFHKYRVKRNSWPKVRAPSLSAQSPPYTAAH